MVSLKRKNKKKNLISRVFILVLFLALGVGGWVWLHLAVSITVASGKCNGSFSTGIFIFSLGFFFFAFWSTQIPEYYTWVVKHTLTNHLFLKKHIFPTFKRGSGFFFEPGWNLCGWAPRLPLQDQTKFLEKKADVSLNQLQTGRFRLPANQLVHLYYWMQCIPQHRCKFQVSG